MSGGPRARILVVDDSHFARSTMTRLLEQAGYEVLTPVSSGEAAVEAACRQVPDLVIMDLQMDGIDGLEATRRIMSERSMRILLFSGASEDVRRTALLAIQAGAVDFLPKPHASGLHRLNQDLLVKVEAALQARPQAARSLGGRTTVIQAPVRFPPPPKGGFGAVAVAVSTGGPSALSRLLAPIPASFPAPILVAQHMPGGWTRSLAEQLDAGTALRVREARPREELLPGSVYVAPGDFHLEIAGGCLARIGQAPAVRGFRPSGDLLLESLARILGERGLAVILTGMGSDGLQGARAVRAAGGQVWAQDERSSVVYGMPRSVVEAGLADVVARPGEMGRLLAEVGRGEARGTS